jgi:hypothetical protein
MVELTIPTEQQCVSCSTAEFLSLRELQCMEFCQHVRILKPYAYTLAAASVHMLVCLLPCQALTTLVQSWHVQRALVDIA